ncbi:MAG: Jag N-terminal domain-containing protein [Campylobacter sp.]|nr:Jag N-terminal domain-containing protein [Campylobacter sp.]
MRIEAENLQEAFQKAAQELNCSVTNLDIKVIQHPSSGFLGFFKKNAIIEANLEKSQRNFDKKRENKKHFEQKNQNSNETSQQAKAENNEKKERRKQKKTKRNEPKQSLSEKNDILAKNAFGENNQEPKAQNDYVIKRLDETNLTASESPKEQNVEQKNEQIAEITEINRDAKKSQSILDNSIIDNFNTPIAKEENKREKVEVDFEVVLPQIKQGLEQLFAASLFQINKIEVSKYSDDCVYIELDGNDAALLIGKEGYRYKAISYLIHNWLNAKYSLSIRLEIAQFLRNQEEMIQSYLVPIIERVQNTGRAQTKPLDGVLVKIALEKLRAQFPEKYVGIKSNGNDKFVVVNDFFKK